MSNKFQPENSEDERIYSKNFRNISFQIQKIAETFINIHKYFTWKCKGVFALKNLEPYT